jgi:cytosine/uracil/thiamine/allantoin permease
MRITLDEIYRFFLALASKFWCGLRSTSGVLYIALTFIGVAWATYGISSLNYSEPSPETLGIYVIGFLVTVLLDSMVTWKRAGSENKNELAISVCFIVMALLLLIWSAYLSIKTYNVELDPPRAGVWKWGANYLLLFILICTIGMSLVLTGVDSTLPQMGSLAKSTQDVADRV